LCSYGRKASGYILAVALFVFKKAYKKCNFI
jgi:hypothetical protein